MTSVTKPPILHLLFAKNDAIFGHSGARNRRSRLRSATFWLVLASLECAVTDLCNDTSVLHRSRLSSSEWRPREKWTIVRLKEKVAKKGGPFWAGISRGSGGDRGKSRKYQEISTIFKGRGRPAGSGPSKILQNPCPGFENPSNSLSGLVRGWAAGPGRLQELAGRGLAGCLASKISFPTTICESRPQRCGNPIIIPYYPKKVKSGAGHNFLGVNGPRRN